MQAMCHGNEARVLASAAMQRSIILACALGFATVAHAQVLPFNEAGVTMGHHHLMVADVDAQRKIWVDALGGEPSGNPPLLFVKFPGVFLILSNGKGTEGTKGSALDHIAFNVKDLRATRAKLGRGRQDHGRQRRAFRRIDSARARRSFLRRSVARDADRAPRRGLRLDGSRRQGGRRRR